EAEECTVRPRSRRLSKWPLAEPRPANKTLRMNQLACAPKTPAISSRAYSKMVVSMAIALAQIDRNNYKRQKAAPGPQAITKPFGIDRRFLIAQRFYQ